MSSKQVYKRWCRVFDEQAAEVFKANADLVFIDIPFEKSLYHLHTLLKEKYPEEPLPEIHRLEVALYSSDDYREEFILDCHNNLYIRSFLFYTLTQDTLKELASLVLFFYLQKKELLIDMILDLVKLQEGFLNSRRHLLKEEEFQVIYGNLDTKEYHFIRALIFVSLLHYPKDHDHRITLIESKNLKGVYFSQKIKEMLNLEESDYKYIQTSRPWNKLSQEGQEKFTVIRNEIENNRITPEEYVQNHLMHKKLMFWCLWTISPLLSIDINRLFSALHEYKTIKRVYLDIPQSSQAMINHFITDNHLPETQVEVEVKKIYPSLVNDYAKETLPYIKILERLRLFKIPQVCIGVDGDELSRRLPYFKDNQLIFEIDKHWEKSIHKEMRELDQHHEQEIIIFFYFLKPMNFLLPYVKNHASVEALIHTDPFTGYGPNQSENQLSFYSHYHPMKQQIPSFVLPELHRFSLKDEKIVFFPYKDDDYFRIKDDSFNRFHLFDSLLFSGSGGGGGGRKQGFISPSPDYHRIRT